MLLDLDYYKAQHEMLLRRNQELEEKVSELETRADVALQRTVESLRADIDTALTLLGIIKHQTDNDDRVVKLLIGNIYEVLEGDDDDEEDYEYTRDSQ